MAYTKEDLDNLQRAIAKGAVEVQMGGERVRFDSLDAMQRRVQIIKRELGIGTPRPRMIYPQTKTGFR